MSMERDHLDDQAIPKISLSIIWRLQRLALLLSLGLLRILVPKRRERRPVNRCTEVVPRLLDR
jgi:hypothetical protein